MFLIENDYFERSEILGWRITKYGKIIFNRLFKKEKRISNGLEKKPKHVGRRWDCFSLLYFGNSQIY